MAVIACVLVIRPLLRGGVPGTYVPCSKEACRAISTTEWNKRESQLEDFFCDIREHYEMSLKKRKNDRSKRTAVTRAYFILRSQTVLSRSITEGYSSAALGPNSSP